MYFSKNSFNTEYLTSANVSSYLTFSLGFEFAISAAINISNGGGPFLGLGSVIQNIP